MEGAMRNIKTEICTLVILRLEKLTDKAIILGGTLEKSMMVSGTEATGTAMACGRIRRETCIWASG